MNSNVDLVSWIILAGLAQLFIGRVLIWCDCEHATDPNSHPQPQPKKGV